MVFDSLESIFEAPIHHATLQLGFHVVGASLQSMMVKTYFMAMRSGRRIEAYNLLSDFKLQAIMLEVGSAEDGRRGCSRRQMPRFGPPR